MKEMAPPSVWGPILWSILHGIGHKTQLTSNKMRVDVTREYIWLIQHMEKIIPCKECRDHVKAFKKKVPPPTGPDEGSWFWALHESVNERLGKPAVIYSADIGSGIIVKELWKVYKDTLRDSLISGSVNGLALKEYGRHIGLWAGFACI